jgi:hypothetical protein
MVRLSYERTPKICGVNARSFPWFQKWIDCLLRIFGGLGEKPHNGRLIPGAARCPITTQGTLKAGAGIEATFAEAGRRRETTGRLQLIRSDAQHLEGAFHSTAAQPLPCLERALGLDITPMCTAGDIVLLAFQGYRSRPLLLGCSAGHGEQKAHQGARRSDSTKTVPNVAS